MGPLTSQSLSLLHKGSLKLKEWISINAFSPVAKWTKIKTLIHFVAVNNWLLHPINVNNMLFLHGYLYEGIYMRPLEGYKKALPGQVYRLNKSLYGLKQATREWKVGFTPKLLAYSLKQSNHDHYLFTNAAKMNL